MNSKQCGIIIFFSIFLGTLLLDPAAPLAKTVYKWTDSHGEIHLTDEPPGNTKQGTLLEEIEVPEREDNSVWGFLGMEKLRPSRKIENPSEEVPMEEQLSAWFSSPEMKLFERWSGWIMTAVFALVIASNLFYSLCLYLICRKVGVRSAWLAWIPVANFFPLVSAAGYPTWYGILFLLPSLASIPQLGANFLLIIVLFAVLLFNLVFILILWIRVCRNFWVSGWAGLLILLPPLFLILLAYLAFREEAEEQTVPRLKPALATLVLFVALTTAFHVTYREAWTPWWKEQVYHEMSSFMESAESLKSVEQPAGEF
jgi:hypothetical protein